MPPLATSTGCSLNMMRRWSLIASRTIIDSSPVPRASGHSFDASTTVVAAKAAASTTGNHLSWRDGRAAAGSVTARRKRDRSEAGASNFGRRFVSIESSSLSMLHSRPQTSHAVRCSRSSACASSGKRPRRSSIIICWASLQFIWILRRVLGQELAQAGAHARKARFYGSERTSHDSGDLSLVETLDSEEHDGAALFTEPAHRDL